MGIWVDDAELDLMVHKHMRKLLHEDKIIWRIGDAAFLVNTLIYFSSIDKKSITEESLMDITKYTANKLNKAINILMAEKLIRITESYTVTTDISG